MRQVSNALINFLLNLESKYALGKLICTNDWTKMDGTTTSVEFSENFKRKKSFAGKNVCCRCNSVSFVFLMYRPIPKCSRTNEREKEICQSETNPYNFWKCNN